MEPVSVVVFSSTTSGNGNSRFFARHISFNLCLPVYHNWMCPSQKMNSIPLYIWSPWINESPSNTVSMFLFVFNAGIRFWCNLCHLGFQRVLMLATVSYILTAHGHSLVHVSGWYSCLWSVVLLSCFWCINEIFDAVEMEKLWEFKIKRKALEKCIFSRTMSVELYSKSI